jgi:hypothetical protein
VKDARLHLAAVVANSILEASRQADGTVTVDTRNARQALATVMAMLLESEPVLDTKDKLHEACSLFAAETLIQAEAMREEFKMTGFRRWIDQAIWIN